MIRRPMVIPVINCETLDCVKSRIRRAVSFFGREGGWLHLDISDGRFTPALTWNNPEELKNFLKSDPILSNLKFEINLMVEQPEKMIEDWLRIGAKRIIVSFESLKNPAFFLEICRQYRAEAMLSFAPETHPEAAGPYLFSFNAFNILAVNPGFSGQTFQPEALEKIRFLRRQRPDVIIEIDGGINPETAKLAKEAGADLFASSSFIFNAADPKKAYLDLVAAVGEQK